MRWAQLMLVENDPGRFDPDFWLDDAFRIINGIWRLNVKPQVEFPSPVTLIPSFPDLPMEHVYPRQPDTNISELYLREAGKGRVV